jgi:putative membrane protein
MKGILIRWFIMTIAILFASYVINGIHVSGFLSALFAAAALGILNAVFRPILIILTLPINILTLGLFTFIINALMLKIASALIPGFEVHGFWPAVLGSLLISIVSWLLNTLVHDIGGKNRGHSDVIDLSKKGDNRWE